MRLKIMVLVGMLAAGCSSAPEDARDMWVVDAIRQASLNNAIVTQKTLYPYHFVDDAAELNELGERDVRVLAKHYRKHAGKLVLRRGDADEDLYRARRTAVLDEMLTLQVPRSNVTVEDGMPGGDGMSSDRVHKAMTETPSSTEGLTLNGAELGVAQ